MPIIRTRKVMSRTEKLLIRELDGGTPFRAARMLAGVSWWDVFLWCLRGCRRFSNRPCPPKDRNSVFLFALADARRRTGCNLGLIINRLVRPFESYSGTSPHA